MDLPTCPACGQSVLDDDPQVCPFCGASMTAKKGAKPAAPAKGGTSPQSAQKPAAQKKKELDPFAIEASTHKAVARVALRPAPGRTHAVKCPMCETEGFVPDAAAGKMVKCANASCMVPLFEAPPIVVDEPEPEPAKRTSPLFVALLLLVIGGGGFGVYQVMFSDSGTDQPQPGPPSEFTSGNDFGQSKQPGRQPTPGEQPDEPVKPAIDLVAYRKNMIERTMLDIATSRERNGNINRSRPFCRQQIAETYARIGQTSNAIEQLEHIDKSDPGIYFQERLPPLVEIGWQQLAAGDRAALEATLKQAEKAGAETDHVSRPRFDRLSSLAALLAASGTLERAKHWTNVATKVSNISDLEEFERLRQASSQITPLFIIPDYKFTIWIDNPLLRKQSPEAVTIALLLAGHGRDQEAVQWMNSLDVRARSDAFSAYINWKASRGESSTAKVEQLLAGQPEVIHVRILSAASSRLREKGNAAAADDFLSKAVAKFDALPKYQELLLPSPHLVVDLKLPDAEPRLHAALAAWELAQAQSAAGQTNEAWASIQYALASCRSIAPSPAALGARPRSDNDSGAEQIKQKLAKELELTTDNEIRINFNHFTSRLKQFEATASRRMSWIQAILDTALDWGLEEQVWEEIRARFDQTDADLKEVMIQAPLMIKLRQKLEAQNKSAPLEQIKARRDVRQLALDPQRQFVTAIDEMIRLGKFDGMAKAAQVAQIDRNRIELILLERMQKLIDEGKIDLCLALIDSLPDVVPRMTSSGTRINDQLVLVREELYFFLGRQAAALGKGTELVETFQNTLPTPTEEISLLAGVAVGLPIPSADRTETEIKTETATPSGGD
ncbi:MAG TPA: hypothetical protein VMM56_12935 [Planctomycetaceae bacterium]|nr:hypothetical protein [Planctomycetaceae bacterium]